MYWICAAATASLVAALIVFERIGRRGGAAIAKTLASAGFVAAALAAGALDSAYGIAVLVALVLGLAGDVLLIPKNKTAFLAGLAIFLVGHLAFLAAFWLRGVDGQASAIAAPVLAAPFVIAWRWLSPHVEGPMRLPVAAYMTAISAMLDLAIGTGFRDRSLLIPVGALMFYVSDLSVARDRFVKPGFENKLWGLPLYYGAQLVIAASVAPGA